MPRPDLHANWTWNLPLPPPFDTVTHKRRRDVASQYNDQPEGSKLATLHPCTLRAVLKYFELRSWTSDPDRPGALGTRDHGNITVCEYPSQNELQAVVYSKNTGEFRATRFCGYPSTILQEEPYSMREGKSSGSALFFAILPVAMEDHEFMTQLTDLQKEYDKKFPDLEKAIQLAAVLCDNIYRRIKNAAALGNAGIKADLSNSATGQFPLLAKKRVDEGKFAATNRLAGEFHVLQGKKGAFGRTVSNEDFAGHFVLTESRKLSAEELRTVPKLEEWYIIPPEVQCLCQHAKETTNSFMPMRDMLLRGPAGTGKTEGAKALAAGFGLPYRHITCSANTTIEDLLGQLLPVTEDDPPEENSSLPTLEDIRMDLASAYCKLTGIYQDVTLEDFCGALLKVANRATEGKGDGSTRYRYVESPLIEALRKGYLIEIQEPTCISNPGVLVGLNSLLDNCKSVVLPTGKVIERHPDAVVVITTNLDYEGTRGMNQSVLSRMRLKVDMNAPDEETMTDRVIKVSGCTEKPVVRKMVKCVRKMAEKCQAMMVSDGSCGMRELISWAQSYMVLHDPVAAAKFTVIPSATADEETQAELRSACLDPLFSA